MATPAPRPRRPNRSAAERGAQYRRADGRATEHLVAAFAAIDARRGQRFSGLAQALRMALQGAHPAAGGLQDAVDDLGAALADRRSRVVYLEATLAPPCPAEAGVDVAALDTTIEELGASAAADPRGGGGGDDSG
ncbi:unnamed protein product, partial [Prorocentrum cordatum]